MKENISSVAEKAKKTSGKFIQEFKEFAVKGNVLDMAVGVVIGGAFTTIINSLVNDIIKPLIGMLGNVDLTNKFIVLGAAPGDVIPDTLEKAQELGLNTLNWGSFVTNLVNFLILALALFIVIKKMLGFINKQKKEEPAPAPTTKVCPHCKSEIHIDADRCPHCTSELK